MLTQKELKEQLNYDPDTGIFTWNVGKFGASLGNIAGSRHKTMGYIFIGLKNKRYLAHRLAFLYMEGYIPENEVDHINGNRSDNRWSNLRHVSTTCNHQNCNLRSDNKSGVQGVMYRKDRMKWISRAHFNNKNIILGSYETKLEAALARLTFEIDCPLWNCNERNNLIIKIKEMWPEFNLHKGALTT